MHIVFVLADHTSAPYFNWFAEYGSKDKDLKFSFVNLYNSEPEMIKEVGKWGSKCYWLPFDYTKRKTELVKSTYRLYKLFKEIKPDVVHCHLFDDSLCGLLAARLAGIKTRVITKGDTGFHYNFSPKWVFLDRFNNANATHIVAISEENKEFIINIEKADKNKVIRIHHGVPLKYSGNQSPELIEQYKDKFNLRGKTVIGSVARLTEWKGHKHMIEAASKLVPKYPDLHFLFVGRGGIKDELQQLVNEKGLKDHITFVEWVDYDHIGSIYGVMDIFLHAAKFEPFGLVIVEAMINKKPVVSTSSGAARDAVTHRKNGYVVDYNNIDSLHEGVKFVLENSPEKMGEEAFKTAMEKFEFAVMYENHKKLYLNLK